MNERVILDVMAWLQHVNRNPITTHFTPRQFPIASCYERQKTRGVSQNGFTSHHSSFLAPVVTGSTGRLNIGKVRRGVKIRHFCRLFSLLTISANDDTMPHHKISRRRLHFCPGDLVQFFHYFRRCFLPRVFGHRPSR